MGKDFMRRLQNLEGTVDSDWNDFAHVIDTAAPSLNATFGKSHGLPLGKSLLLYGPPKGGKTVVTNMFGGKLHQDDPEAIVIKFNTEFRETAQLTEGDRNMWGIDPSRYVAYEVNHADLIFDRIENDIAAMCQDGAPIKLIIIDSLNSIIGRRLRDAKSINQQLIGDDALTLQTGFKRILSVQRKYKIAMILTSHVRAEMDQVEQMRGNKVRPGVSFGVQHHCEYFMYVEPNRTKDGKKTLLGAAFENAGATDVNDKADRTGHKIRVQMKASSLGPPGRMGEFTLDYKQGLINVYEEVFLMALNRGLIQRPTNRKYIFDGKEFDGFDATLKAFRDHPEWAPIVTKECKRRDMSRDPADSTPEDSPEAPKAEPGDELFGGDE
jgi:RecA/RadA recombinase